MAASVAPPPPGGGGGGGGRSRRVAVVVDSHERSCVQENGTTRRRLDIDVEMLSGFLERILEDRNHDFPRRRVTVRPVESAADRREVDAVRCTVAGCGIFDADCTRGTAGACYLDGDLTCILADITAGIDIDCAVTLALSTEQARQHAVATHRDNSPVGQRLEQCRDSRRSIGCQTLSPGQRRRSSPQPVSRVPSVANRAIAQPSPTIDSRIQTGHTRDRPPRFASAATSGCV